MTRYRKPEKFGDRRLSAGVGIGLASWRPWATKEKQAVDTFKQALVVRVPLKVESLNRMMQVHWSKRHRIKKQWEWALMAAAAGRASGPYRRIEIVSFRQKFLDDDNLRGGAKPVLDALQDLEWIVGDDMESIDPVIYRQVKVAKGEECTIVKVC